MRQVFQVPQCKAARSLRPGGMYLQPELLMPLLILQGMSL